jgi:hypothetical protein
VEPRKQNADGSPKRWICPWLNDRSSFIFSLNNALPSPKIDEKPAEKRLWQSGAKKWDRL